MSQLYKLLVFHTLLLEMFPSYRDSFLDTTDIYYASWPHKGSAADGCAVTTRVYNSCVSHIRSFFMMTVH